MTMSNLNDAVFPMGKAVQKAVDAAKLAATSTTVGMTWPLPIINANVRPLGQGETCVISALSGHTKTMSLLKILDVYGSRLLEQETGIGVLVTLEDYIETHGATRLSSVVGISADSILKGRLTEEEIHRLDLARMEASTSPIWLIGNSMDEKIPRVAMTMKNIQQIVETIAQTQIIRVVAIDYLTIIEGAGGYGANDRSSMAYQAAEWFIRTWKVPHSAPRILVAQAGPHVADKKYAIPGLQDCENIKMLGAWANIFISLYRPYSQYPNSPITNLMGLPEFTATDDKAIMYFAKVKKAKAQLAFPLTWNYNDNTVALDMKLFQESPLRNTVGELQWVRGSLLESQKQLSVQQMLTLAV